MQLWIGRFFLTMSYGRATLFIDNVKVWCFSCNITNDKVEERRHQAYWSVGTCYIWLLEWLVKTWWYHLDRM